MEEEHIQYTEYNVSSDKDALEKLRKRKLMQLPVIEIDEEMFTSTSIAKLKGIIKERA